MSPIVKTFKELNQNKRSILLEFVWYNFFHFDLKESATNLTSRQEGRASSANGVIEAVSQSQNGNQPSNNNNDVDDDITHEKQRTPSPLFTKKSSPVHSATVVGGSAGGGREKRAGSPVILPPISRDGSLIGDESIMWFVLLLKKYFLYFGILFFLFNEK